MLARHPWLAPLFGGFAALAVVGGMLFLLVRTRDHQAHARPVAKAKPTQPAEPLLAPDNTAPTGEGMGAMGGKPGPAEVEDDDNQPDPSEEPIVIGKPDPELDKLVTTEAKGYEAPKAKNASFLVPITPPGEKSNPAALAAKIDAVIDAKLAAAKVPASPQADDAEFLRRVYLDIVGVIPPAAKVKAFLADKSPGKRDKVIDVLLADPRFGENFAHYWHDLLVKRDPDNNRLIKTHDVFLKWLTGEFNRNKPWDGIVRSLLTAHGDQALVGETFFVVANTEMGQPQPQKVLGTASALFHGNQMMCAECHVHPMTPEWSQEDFWGMAAFFGKTRAERSGGKKNANGIATLTDAGKAPKGKQAAKSAMTQADGTIRIPDPRNDGKFIGTAKPKLLGEPVVDKSKVNRGYAADWFTSPKNPFFSRAAVNRLWAQFFATGFINPLDDIRPDSTPTHPEALELLAGEFIAAKFDVKHMIRVIVKTQAYQRSSKTLSENAEDVELYSHMGMKVLAPRMLFQSLAVATSNAVDVPTDAVANGKATKNDTAGKGLAFFDAREYDVNPGEYTYGVPQLLKLMNAKLPPACDSAAKQMMRLGSRDQVIDQMYLSALSRHPTPAEAKKLAGFVAKHPDATKGYSAALWVLLNTAEFVNNH